MTTRQKFLGLTLLLILITVVAAGTTGTLAQDNGGTILTPNAPSGSAYGWNMHGMMWGNWQAETMWTAVADVLNIDVSTLVTALRSGTTFAQLAETQGVDVQTVYDAALTVMTDHMNAMVEAGYLTQRQADARLAWMHDNMAQIPMWTDGDYDPCFMGGMMGNGMHGSMLNGYGSYEMHGMMDGEMHSGMMGGHHG